MLEPAETPFKFAVSRALSTAVVTLHGELDQPRVEGLTSILRTLIDDRSNRTVVVDLHDVSRVDPSATTLFNDAIGWGAAPRCPLLPPRPTPHGPRAHRRTVDLGDHHRLVSARRCDARGLNRRSWLPCPASIPNRGRYWDRYGTMTVWTSA